MSNSKQNRSLEDILRASTPPQGQQEFRLVAYRHPSADDVTFMLHPMGKDGDTGDFWVADDSAYQYGWCASQDPLKDGLDWREILPDRQGPRKHDWFTPEFIEYECCRNCGIVRRADDKNKPCKGRVHVALRD